MSALEEYAPVIGPCMVVRRKALADRSIDPAVLRRFADVSGETGDLVLVGPLFGVDAVLAMVRALESHGLTYVDDFYAIEIDLPEWLTLGARLATD